MFAKGETFYLAIVYTLKEYNYYYKKAYVNVIKQCIVSSIKFIIAYSSK